MRCERISVDNFRNISHAELDFSPEVNILTGNNAQGKTNMLEALNYISLGKSFRSTHDNEVIKFGEKSAALSLDFSDSIRRQNISLTVFRDKRKQVLQNKVKIFKMSDIVGIYKTVLFTPEHLSLIKEGPGERRNFLDIAISQLRPKYLFALQRYNKILKQRNQLIKSAPFDRAAFDSTIELWSLQLAEQAAVISKYRYEYIKRAAEKINNCFSDMTNKRESVDFRYSGTLKIEDSEYEDTKKTTALYTEALTSGYEREIFAGTTLYGIHKDDVEILLNDKNARLYCSQGQQRSLALAMKIAEGEISREEMGEYPVFLLDDVLSELDSERRKYLVSNLSGRQVILTCCESGDFGIIKNEDTNIIEVENGNYVYRDRK